MWIKFIKGLDSLVFGSFFQLLRAQTVVRAKLRECQPEQFESDERLQHPIEKLDRALATSVERVQRIEDKATRTLLGVAVAVAVFGATSNILGSDGPLSGHHIKEVRTVAGVLLVLAMLYLVSSGLLALQAYRIGELYRPELADRVPLVDSKKESIFLLFCIEQNYRVATMRSNLLSACFGCLRNGLVVLFSLGVLIVIVSS